MADHYDVVIVGSGAGGGTLAHLPDPDNRVALDADGDHLIARLG
jgi:choline dehydrogenase-like flavoprotein